MLQGPRDPASRAHAHVAPLAGVSHDLMTAGEVARRLGVSVATVYALVERGELSHVRVSNAIRVEAAVLEAYVASRKRGL